MQTQNIQFSILDAARDLSARNWIVLWMAVVLLIAALLVPVRIVALGLGLGSMSVFFLVALVELIGNRRPTHDPGVGVLCRAFETDRKTVLYADRDGLVNYANDVARSRFAGPLTTSIVLALDPILANPAAVVFRLHNQAQRAGVAEQDVTTRTGHAHLEIHAGPDGGFLWIIDDRSEVDGRANLPVAKITLPMMTVTADGKILNVNEALRLHLGSRPTHLDRVFTDLPIRQGGLHEIKTADGGSTVRVFEDTNDRGHREIFLAAADPDDISGATSRQIIDELPVALLKLAVDGQILMANRQARRLLDHPLNGQVHLNELVQGLGRSVSDWLEDGLNGRSLNRPEVVAAIGTDTEKFLQISLSRVVEDGQVALFAILGDATELKTLEAQFVQSQKMQAIGQLAGGVAHDFNNLLTAISGYCDLLLLRHDAGDPDFADLVQINQNANRAAALVGQLLAFSRKQNLQPEVLDVRDAISDLTHLLNRLVGETVTLDLAHAEGATTIRADRRQLEQVIVNLVVNARDSMPKGGRIRIDTQTAQLAEPMKRDRAVVPAGDYVVIRVTDEGHGIGADKLGKVFEPFYTTKKVGEGTGLGLSTAYGIIKQSGGFIFVDSTPGSGAEFAIFFPQHEAQPQVEPPEPATMLSANGEARGGVVLLVEDEAPVRSFASRALRMRGYAVIEAENAEDALRQLEDKDLQVDVFVTDVVMPGMDGPTWVKKALETRPEVRVVFVSGYAEETITENQAQIPNAVFLPKPFSLGELASKVQAQVH